MAKGGVFTFGHFFIGLQHIIMIRLEIKGFNKIV